MTTDLYAKRRGTVDGHDALLAFPSYLGEDVTFSPAEPHYALIPEGHVLVATLTDVLGTMDRKGTHHDLVWHRLPDDSKVTISVL